MNYKKFPRVTQGVGAHDTFRPVTVASAPEHVSDSLAPPAIGPGNIPPQTKALGQLVRVLNTPSLRQEGVKT